MKIVYYFRYLKFTSLTDTSPTLRGMKKTFFLICITIGVFATAKGQNILIRHGNKDTTYIKEYYRKHLVIRAYESTKFNNFKYIDAHNKLIFKPNNHNNFGVGFNYRFISLNFGFYVPFAAKNSDVYGTTKPLDLQTHIYLHKFIVDFYGQFYKGYFLSDTRQSIFNGSDDHPMLRPDIATRDISLEVQYLFNDKKFSYNAPYYQNEIQKKSAGSFLLGGGIYHTDAKGDSALAPTNITYTDFFRNYKFNASSNTGIGFITGYAYTQVIKKIFFITDALSGGAGYNRSTLSDNYLDQNIRKNGVQFNLTERFAAGYSSDKYFAGITYIRLITEDHSIYPHTWQEVNTGNFRITVAERFRLKKALIPKSELIEIE